MGPGCLYFTIDGGEVGAGPVGVLSATTRAITLIGAARRELATATRAFRPRRYGSVTSLWFPGSSRGVTSLDDLGIEGLLRSL